ncbi:hypothetical protein PISMIDRAFT_20203 [Pisolithus microcarpus 441]|uniref:Unplaced genomic scaffold scaffold_816, whole genome shotgun sequence n=1 Tax=Pisolithus microcarpus 441 TaxID=765257 RepID=A0A0C9Y9F4_9AGAM|nr:hypothetical protein PISMIDRAFT_20203 [Pisolithus microcarpus 441]
MLRRSRLTVCPCWVSPFVGDSVYAQVLFYLVLACFLSILSFLPLYLYHSARGGTAPGHYVYFLYWSFPLFPSGTTSFLLLGTSLSAAFGSGHVLGSILTPMTPPDSI